MSAILSYTGGLSTRERCGILPTMTLTEFKKIIIETLRLEGMTPEMIPDDHPLFGSGLGLDSIDALEIVVALEKHLGLSLRAHELEKEAFSSVSSLFQCVGRQVAAQGGRLE